MIVKFKTLNISTTKRVSEVKLKLFFYFQKSFLLHLKTQSSKNTLDMHYRVCAHYLYKKNRQIYDKCFLFYRKASFALEESMF